MSAEVSLKISWEILKNYSSKKLCKLIKHNYEQTLKLDPSKILIDIVPISLALKVIEIGNEKKNTKKTAYSIALNDQN